MGYMLLHSLIIHNALDAITSRYPRIAPLVTDIVAAGGRALLVGGAVRDIIMQSNAKDIDIEIHNINADQLEKILRSYGPVNLVGKTYGVYRLVDLDVDWSLPRTDASGRKPQVVIDPYMSIKNAFERRDLTMNAMGIDLSTRELIDPFGGLADINARRLRAPNIDLFVQDPLRFYRVMQFISRFEMIPNDELNACCASMVISTVSRDRITAEFEKLFLRSKRPSLGIRWLDTIDRLKDVMPELYATKGVPQQPEWHPEGDVFEHSMQTIDAAAAIKQDNNYKQLALCFAALCHDLGKAVTTELIDGKWRSLGHEHEGVPLARALLKRVTNKKDLIHDVCLLVRYHMLPPLFIKDGARPPAYRRLANKLMPRMNIELLADLSRADRRGRNPAGHEPLHNADKEVDAFVRMAENIAVAHAGPAPILRGRDFLDIVGPGTQLGYLVKEAYRLQIEEGITDKQELKDRVLAAYRAS